MTVKLRRAIALIASTITLMAVLASPASAGYKEGYISCVSGYVPNTVSSSSVYTNHYHWFEHTGGTNKYDTWVGWMYDAYSSGDWSVQTAYMTSGYAGCMEDPW